MNGFITKHALNGFVTFLRWQNYFIIDKLIIKANLCGIYTIIGIIDMIKMSPINSTKAHGTWFARRVDFISLKIESTQRMSSFTDTIHFCMGCWVVVNSHAI